MTVPVFCRGCCTCSTSPQPAPPPGLQQLRTWAAEPLLGSVRQTINTPAESECRYLHNQSDGGRCLGNIPLNVKVCQDRFVMLWRKKKTYTHQTNPKGAVKWGAHPCCCLTHLLCLRSGPNRGHYITIVKSHGFWLLFDDDIVEVRNQHYELLGSHQSIIQNQHGCRSQPYNKMKGNWLEFHTYVSNWGLFALSHAVAEAVLL